MSRLPSTGTMLVVACAASIGLLEVSQFMDLFHFTPPGGEALSAQDALDQHSVSIVILGAFALVALFIFWATGARPAAVGVAFLGLAALLIFLIGDLPDVNKVGTLDDPQQSFIDAKAEPQLGFWLELVGALLLTICGAALATLPDEQQISSRRGDRSETTSARAADERAEASYQR